MRDNPSRDPVSSGGRCPPRVQAYLKNSDVDGETIKDDTVDDGLQLRMVNEPIVCFDGLLDRTVVSILRSTRWTVRGWVLHSRITSHFILREGTY